MNSPVGPTLEELLVIEDDPAILEFKCRQTQIPFWPLIRGMFLRMMMSDLLYSGTSLLRAAPSGASVIAKLRTFGASALHNGWLRLDSRSRADVFLMATGLGIIQLNGKWLNRLSDYFALCLPGRTTIMEDQHEWKWPFPRQTRPILLHAPLQARNYLIARMLVSDQHTREANRLVHFVAERALRYLRWQLGEERELQLTTFLALKAAALPHQYRAYQALLARICPRVLIKEDACYGPSAALLVAAKEMGIRTAEFQHGAVSRGHDGYNVAPSLAASAEYRKVLPEYFLGYGRWWNEQINVPVTKIAVGNPHRDWQLTGMIPVENKTDLLVLGDGVETDRYLSLARDLAALTGSRGFRTVFRPHPLERARVRSLQPDRVAGLIVDQSPDIYLSLARAYAVISEVSTGMFEAVGVADRVFLLDTPKARFGYPTHPFQCFQKVEELAGMLIDGGPGGISAGGSDAIWAFHWKENYLQFLESCGVTVRVKGMPL